MSLKDAYLSAVERLQMSGVPEPELDAWYLLEHVTGISRAAYYAEPDRELGEEQRNAYEALVGRRALRIPLQHITGVQEFMGLEFSVSGAVLIPRQDTEVLVEEALRVLKEEDLPGQKGETAVLDVCTGSGCILLSVLYYAKQAGMGAVRGTGSDLSGDALCMAEKNAEKLGLKAQLLQSDLFDEISGRYSIILSNPPYIRRQEIEGLQPEVRDGDPRMALDGGEDGLDFYRKISRESTEHLLQGGYLMFEIGCGQAADVAGMMEREGFADIRVKKDLAGLDRVVYGRYRQKG